MSKSKSRSSKCSKGQILRKGYSKKSGTKVKSKCIKATSQSGLKRSTVEKKIMKEQKRIHDLARQKFGTPKCKQGDILREGYHKKKYSRKSSSRSKKQSRVSVKSTWVAPACIKSTTGKGHGKQLFILEKGDLSPFGYHNVEKLSRLERQKALKKALKKIKPLSLARKINALKVLNKNRNPKLARIFQEDFDFIESTNEYKNR